MTNKKKIRIKKHYISTNEKLTRTIHRSPYSQLATTRLVVSMVVLSCQIFRIKLEAHCPITRSPKRISVACMSSKHRVATYCQVRT